MAQNPVLRQDAFERSGALGAAQSMTLQGTINKTFVLLALCVAGGVLGWTKAAAIGGLVWVALIVAFILAICTSFKPAWSPLTSPVYAFLEGIVLGWISIAYNAQYPGIILQAVAITFLVFAVMLFVYKTGILKVTQGFMTAVVSATAAIAIMYVGSWIFSLLGGNIAYLTSSSPLSIGISVVVCVVAALNLMLDFQFIAVMSSRGDAPKFMEWYGGFGLLVTIVWLYIEILKLLGKAKRR